MLHRASTSPLRLAHRRSGTPYDYFYEGTVRGALLLRSQSEKHAQAIRNAISSQIRSEFGSDGPWEAPIPAAVVSAKAI